MDLEFSKSNTVIKQKKRTLNRMRLSCGVRQTRTADTRIFSPMLYQLSYDPSIGLQT